MLSGDEFIIEAMRDDEAEDEEVPVGVEERPSMPGVARPLLLLLLPLALPGPVDERDGPEY